ncbi:MAG TPA: sigma-70 family RNA polymerase sigma factor [Candidatus Dormibacteraeota bacterium]|jgi:RNA polymerase sigma-70 factor (ECF subfamily)|nr:sigma-70 family RNA polymerase sigma factor [Candidatus Dormibacteraeota bacterium]
MATTDAELRLLQAARQGDQDAYTGLLEPHRAGLYAHCYRLLGSVQDAEDAMQDTMLRAWRGLPRFDGRGPLRAWLYRIATNASLTLLRRRPRRVLPVDYGPPAGPGQSPDHLDEPIWLEPFPDRELNLADGRAGPDARYEQRESLELAFVAALQLIPARQRAVLILRDVVGFSAREVAETLDMTVASVNSALQRAHKAVDERVPEESQQTTLSALGDERLSRLVQDYADALERADVNAIVGMLTADPSWSMPPAAAWYRGLDSIVEFLTNHALTVRWQHVRTWANGQAAVGCYRWSEEAGQYQAMVLDVLTLRGDRIESVTAFIKPEIFPSFGLPEALPA